MLYSSAGFLALLVHLIINHDVLFDRGDGKLLPAHADYRAYLLAVTAYYVTDIFWGILYARGLIALTIADTAAYFVCMALSILLWTRFTIAYLNEKTRFGRLLATVGWLFFLFELVVVLVNFFIPALFSFDAHGVYHAGPARHITLGAQVGMFLMTALYALFVASRSSGTMKFRHLTVGLSSIAMTGFVVMQVLHPLLPLYAIGCLLASCVLHSFVLENEKEEYRGELEARLQENILKGNYYDLLTGLPGMSYFFELTQGKRAEAFKTGEKHAFLYFNLSGMKFYNKGHGFAEGDRLLHAFAQQLIGSFGTENCSRFGQDHFVVYAPEAGLEEKLNALFARWEELNKDGPAILVGVYPDDAADVDITGACDFAKVACDEKRNSYVSSIRYFDSDLLLRTERQLYIISHLDRALAENWVRVYYQPIVRAANGRVCDEEALARWNDPERGILSPGEFIPVLEDAGLIYKLDLYILDQVLEKMRRTRDHGLYLVPQSINLSRSDFDACDIVEEIRKRVDNAGIERGKITVEITESIVGRDFDFIKTQVERFRALGFPVWMDDFGSGYSSLDVLQSMQVDVIKFDMRFMQQFDHGDKSKVILTELMKMAVGLGIDTVCEGVEREDQVEFLREIGCSRLQGYFYARPMPLEDILARYETGRQIGFENPAETDYYDAIGRINLYDLASVAKEETDRFQHFFSTLPMAIIEVRGDKARFTRTNPAYRDFLERTFHFTLAGIGDSFEETPAGPGRPFVEMLRQCCREGGRAVFDEHMPDGTRVHSFMRRIAENPLTDTTAAAVAVLAITDG